MIALRSYGNDDNPAGASTFVSVPVPVGTTDGDLVLVGITIPAANVEITPPDDFELVYRTDKTLALGLAVYRKIAFSELTRWVFALDTSCAACGAVAVLKGAEDDDAIEAYFSAITMVPVAALTVPAVPVADNEENVLYFLGAAFEGVFDEFNGASHVTRTNQAGFSHIEIQRLEVLNAGTVASATPAYKDDLPPPAIPGIVNTERVVVAVVVRPTVGNSSIDDVRERIVGKLPRGADRIYDLAPDGDYYKFFQAIAASLKGAFDLVDTLRAELFSPRRVLAAWERVFGLTTTNVAKKGTLAQRRAQVTAAWRVAAGQNASAPNVQAVLAPLLGYSDPANVEIVRCSRSGLEREHTYPVPADLSIAASSTTTIKILVSEDAGRASSSGARLTLYFSDADLSGYSITLTAPDGTSKTWNRGWSTVALVLYGKEFAHTQIQGTWTLAITRGAGGAQTLYQGGGLFVEAIGRHQDTGGASAHWGVYADPNHLSENGTTADLEAADAAIKRMAPAHTDARVILSQEAWPDTSGGAHCAIPDRFLPV